MVLDVTKLFTKNIQGKRFRNLLSLLFYRASKSVLASIIKSNGRIIAVTYDFSAVIISWTIVYCLITSILITLPDYFTRMSNNFFLILLSEWKTLTLNLLLVLVPQVFLFKYMGLYRGFWRFTSTQDLQKLLYVSCLGGIISFIVLKLNIPGLFINNDVKDYVLLSSYTASTLYCIFLMGFLSIARLFIRFARNYKYLYPDCQRVIIVGAGNAGEGLARDLLRDNSHRYKPIAFVDDDLLKLGREIHGIRVIGSITELPKLIRKLSIDLVLIAIPSATSASMRSVLEMCEKANVPCYTLPGLNDLTNGRVNISVLRHISLEDLLGRYPVDCQWSSIKDYIKNKVILITGGGGSIGSELCRQIASFECAAGVIVLDNNEYNLYAIDLELRQKFPKCKLYTILGSITDALGLKAILKKYSPNIIFHAAAYKHVPMLEHQPRPAIYNNIIGTQVLAEAAVESNVEKFILISSDKAVNPANIMGATKRAAEYFCQNLNDYVKKTSFITVRFGNVLDSVGSVIPLFRKQIEAGGPVTVTHPEITRFFMTIREACQLILQAALLGKGGEIFVLDMGDPIKIKYLAEQMIKLAGRIVDKDIKIVYTGLRPGEKLYEECFYSNEKLQPTAHTKILRAQSRKRNFEEVQNICNNLKTLCIALANNRELICQLEKLVPEYKPYQTYVDGKEEPKNICDVVNSLA